MEIKKMKRKATKENMTEHGYSIDINLIPENFDVDTFIKEWLKWQETGLCNPELSHAFHNVKEI